MDTEPCAEGGRSLGSIVDGAALQLRGVDFGAAPGASAVTLRVASPLAGCSVDVLADGVPVGPPCALPNTGAWQTFQNVTCPVARAAGVAANLTFSFHGPRSANLLNLLYWSFSGGAASGATPPPVVVRVALRAAANNHYLCARDGDGVVTPSGAAPCAWELSDLADGTWALAAAEGAEGQHWACLGATGPLAVTADAPGAPCTRFWLYGTPVGSYALLSAGAGRFVTAAPDAATPVAAGGLDPRTTPGDGARFVVLEL
jgi:hypothetical protein